MDGVVRDVRPSPARLIGFGLSAAWLLLAGFTLFDGMMANGVGIDFLHTKLPVLMGIALVGAGLVVVASIRRPALLVACVLGGGFVAYVVTSAKGLGLNDGGLLGAEVLLAIATATWSGLTLAALAQRQVAP